MENILKFCSVRGIRSFDGRFLSAFIPNRFRFSGGDSVILDDNPYVVLDVRKSSDYFNIIYVQPIEDYKICKEEISILVDKFLESLKDDRES